jgi:hypothetical protein
MRIKSNIKIKFNLILRDKIERKKINKKRSDIFKD